MKKVLFDSSCWIEILSSGPKAKSCEKLMEGKNIEIVVPSLVLFEVYKKVKKMTSDEEGLAAVAVISQNTVESLGREVALLAADLSVEHKLGMADSMILAHAQDASAELITLDNDFRGLSGVRVL